MNPPHHDHMSHSSDMDMPMCSMNMLFTWSTENLCIVFPQWRVTSTFSLLVSLLAVATLTAGYEAVREASRRYEERLSQRLDRVTRRQSVRGEEQQGKMVRAILYGFQVFYSFFIMLLFMTYNGWIMIAVGVGATIGFLLFAGPKTSSSKDAACH